MSRRPDKTDMVMRRLLRDIGGKEVVGSLAFI
jgi:hypothetical protein